MSLDIEAPAPIQTEWVPFHPETLLGDRDTILFVEDEGFVREVTTEVLRSAGYRILVAENAAQAARLYDQHRGHVNLLLTDVILPGETGPALAGRLQDTNPQLKTLFITGYVEQMGLCQSPRENILAKPFSTQSLLARVSQLLNDGDETAMKDENSLMPACGAA